MSIYAIDMAPLSPAPSENNERNRSRERLIMPGRIIREEKRYASLRLTNLPRAA